MRAWFWIQQHGYIYIVYVFVCMYVCMYVLYRYIFVAYADVCLHIYKWYVKCGLYIHMYVFRSLSMQICSVSWQAAGTFSCLAPLYKLCCGCDYWRSFLRRSQSQGLGSTIINEAMTCPEADEQIKADLEEQVGVAGREALIYGPMD